MTEQELEDLIILAKTYPHLFDDRDDEKILQDPSIYRGSEEETEAILGPIREEQERQKREKAIKVGAKWPFFSRKDDN